MRPLRAGLVGLGFISRFYLHALEQVPSVTLAAACDVDEAAFEPLYGRVPCHRDHREMIEQEDLDAILVTVPNDMHATVCRRALEAGLPVCVEKPLATRLADGRFLVECARAAGVTLFTAFHRRYNSAVVGLLDRLRSAPPIESLTVRYLERIEDHIGGDRWYLDPKRCGGGCVADNGPNAFDLARLFLGHLHVADVAVERDLGGIDRRARIVLLAASGARATVELDWSYDGERKDVEVRLVDGSLHAADMLAGHPGFKESLWHEYVGVLGDFERTLTIGRPRPSSGLAALELVDATYRAERLRRTAGVRS